MNHLCSNPHPQKNREINQIMYMCVCVINQYALQLWESTELCRHLWECVRVKNCKTFNYYLCMISAVSAVLIKRKEAAELAFESAWCNLQHRGVFAWFNAKMKCLLHSSTNISTRRLPCQENFTTIGGFFSPFDTFFFLGHLQLWYVKIFWLREALSWG